MLRRAAACLLALLSLSASAAAEGPMGPVYDITHFDVIPLDTQGVDFQKTAYKALFAYRDASRSDAGLASFRIINWQAALNHSFIVDVWNTKQAYEQHLALDHSIAFRFAVQNQPPGGACCIGSPIDDRQYRQVGSIGVPWTGDKFPRAVGPEGAAWIVIYVDFMEQVLRDFRGNVGLNQA